MNPPNKPKVFDLAGHSITGTKEVSDMISHFKLFEDFPGDQIRELSRYIKAYNLEAETTVFSQGDPGQFMCLIAEGQVEIVGFNQEGKSHRLVLIPKGKSVGEMSIIDDEMRSASCITTKPSTLLILTKESYADIVKKQPFLAINIVTKLARHMSHRMRSLSGQLVDIMDTKS